MQSSHPPVPPPPLPRLARPSNRIQRHRHRHRTQTQTDTDPDTDRPYMSGHAGVQGRKNAPKQFWRETKRDFEKKASLRGSPLRCSPLTSTNEQRGSSPCGASLCGGLPLWVPSLRLPSFAAHLCALIVERVLIEATPPTARVFAAPSSRCLSL